MRTLDEMRVHLIGERALTVEESLFLLDASARARRMGIREGLRLYAWWKDGVQYVGTCGMTLEKALEKYPEEAAK